jgi:hypothetical protein
LSRYTTLRLLERDREVNLKSEQELLRLKSLPMSYLLTKKTKRIWKRNKRPEERLLRKFARGRKNSCKIYKQRGKRMLYWLRRKRKRKKD